MPNGQTIVEYGDITLYRCTTTEFRQRPIFAGPDLKYWKFIVTVTGYLTGMPSSNIYHDVVGGATRDGSAADAHRQVRWRVKPRKNFRMAIGCGISISDGTTILFAQPMLGNVTQPSDLEASGLTYFDLEDGPRCLAFDIVNFGADNVYKVQATFEINRAQCSDDDHADGATTGVLSNKWSSIDALDYNLRCTRMHRGILELATAVFSPHWFRYLVVPPLSNGFRREHMSFQATEDGKKLLYNIVDQEVAISAPPPARKWAVQHTEATIAQQGVVGHASCNVTLEGDSNCDKTQLILLGLNIITAKLVGTTINGAPAQKVTFNDLTITDFTGDVNMVHLSANCSTLISGLDGTYIPRTDGFRKIISAADLPAFSATYDPRTSAGGRLGDTPEYQGPCSLVGIFRTYLQDSCDNNRGLNIRTNSVGEDLNETPDDEPQAEIDAVVINELDDSSADYYSTSQLAAPYTYFQAETTYYSKMMRAAHPIATAVYTGVGVDTSDATRLIGLSRPQGRMRIRLMGERTGNWPEFPDPEAYGAPYSGSVQYATNTNSSLGAPGIAPVYMKCLKSKLLGGTVIPTFTGLDRFRARMEMLFATNRIPTPAELLKFGHNLWSTDGSGNGTISNQNLTNSNMP